MLLQIDNSFIRDTKKSPKNIQKIIPQIIELIRAAETIRTLPKVKKIAGYKNAYRIKIDDYWIGFYLDGETVILSRILSRKEVYRFFPHG